MTRSLLDQAQIHPAIRQMIAASHAATVAEAKAALAANAIVVIGMAHNPFVRKARKLLDAAGLPYHYLEYGSYVSGWRRRTALKMWSGWPTFPMVFVQGVLIGGASQLQGLIDSGELGRMVAEKR